MVVDSGESRETEEAEAGARGAAAAVALHRRSVSARSGTTDVTETAESETTDVTTLGEGDGAAAAARLRHARLGGDAAVGREGPPWRAELHKLYGRRYPKLVELVVNPAQAGALSAALDGYTDSRAALLREVKSAYRQSVIRDGSMEDELQRMQLEHVAANRAFGKFTVHDVLARMELMAVDESEKLAGVDSVYSGAPPASVGEGEDDVGGTGWGADAKAPIRTAEETAAAAAALRPAKTQAGEPKTVRCDDAGPRRQSARCGC